MCDALAAQVPFWTPGSAHGYHARTFGWLVGEVIRRVSGRTVGKFVADEIAGPLDLDFFIGLPASARPRVSRLVATPQPDVPQPDLPDVPERDLPFLRPVTDPAEIDFNAAEVQAAEMPAINERRTWPRHCGNGAGGPAPRGRTMPRRPDHARGSARIRIVMPGRCRDGVAPGDRQVAGLMLSAQGRCQYHWLKPG